MKQFGELLPLLEPYLHPKAITKPFWHTEEKTEIAPVLFKKYNIGAIIYGFFVTYARFKPIHRETRHPPSDTSNAKDTKQKTVF